jgi:hypothetical protein
MANIAASGNTPISERRAALARGSRAGQTDGLRLVKPIIRQTLDEIVFAWPELDIRLQLSKLRETEAGALRGMLRLDQYRTNGSGGHIWWAQVSLTTATDRKTLCGKLQKASPRADGEWEADVDRAFLEAYERQTNVPEPIVLADVEEASPDTRFLYQPVLPEGQIALLLADQGATKSYLMLYLAACTVLGSESVFGPPARSGPVIFFDWEVDEVVARRRLGWICRGLGIEQLPRDLHYVNMCERGRLFDRIRDMRYQIDKLQPALVVVDSLTFATGGDLNSPEYAAPTMSAIGSLGGQQVTKLVSAHPSKAVRNASVDDISVIGSALFEYRARAVWLMRRESRRGSRFGVSMTPRKPFDGIPPETLAYRMVFDNQAKAARFESTRLEDVPELEGKSLSLADRIRRTLAKKGKLDTNQLADELAEKADVVRMECNRIADVMPFASGGGRGKPTVWGLADQPNQRPPWWSN